MFYLFLKKLLNIFIYYKYYACKIVIYSILYYFKLKTRVAYWGLGIRGWGLGIGDWGLANPQSPIPNPQSPICY